jgi:hypothetical protein
VKREEAVLASQTRLLLSQAQALTSKQGKDRLGKEDVPTPVGIDESGSPARMVSSGPETKGEPHEKVQQMVVRGKSEGAGGGWTGCGSAGPGRSA